MVLKKLAFALGLMSFAGSVQAQGYDWQGLYAGFGMANPRAHITWTDRTTGFASLPGDWRRGPVGPVLGYNWQRNSIVYGLEADYGANNIYSNALSSTTFACGTGCEVDVTRMMTLRARVGQSFDRALVYLTGGVYAGQVAATYDGTPLPVQTQIGLMVGGGLEYAVGRRMRVNVEFMFGNLGRLDATGYCAGDCGANLSHSLLRIGARWALGGPRRAARVIDSGETHDWSGRYVGATFTPMTLSRGNLTADGGAATTFSHWDGLAAGAVIGHGWQRGRLVAQIEGGIIVSNREARTYTTPSFDCGTELTCVTQLRNSVAVTGRVGFAHERFLYFTSLTAASHGVAAGFSDIGIITAGRVAGGALSLGLAYAIDDSTRLSTEFRFHRNSGLQVAPPCPAGCRADTSHNEVLVTLTRRW